MEGWKSIRISVPIDGGIPVVSGDMGTFMPILANIVEGGQYMIGETIFGGLGRALFGDVEVLREENPEEVIFFAVVFVFFLFCCLFYFPFLSFRLVRRFSSSRHIGSLAWNSTPEVVNNIHEKELLLCCCLRVLVLFQCFLNRE